MFDLIVPKGRKSLSNTAWSVTPPGNTVKDFQSRNTSPKRERVHGLPSLMMHSLALRACIRGGFAVAKSLTALPIGAANIRKRKRDQR